MKRIVLIASMLVAAGFQSLLFAGNIGEPVYGIYSETFPGMKYKVSNVSGDANADPDGAYMGAWNSQLIPQSSSREGNEALKVITWGQHGGVFMQFGYNGTDASPKVPTSMQAYAGGSLIFDIKASSGSETAIKLEWQNAAGQPFSAERWIKRDLGIPLDEQWHHVVVPLSSFTGLDLSRVVNVVFTSAYRSSYMPEDIYRTFWIDNVIWKKPNVATINLALKNRFSQETPTALSWSTAEAGSQWTVADQYFEIDQREDTPGWFLQIYTDNKASDASPRYTGNGDPAGMVGVNEPGSPDASESTLSMCWRVVDVTTTTLTIQQGTGGNPNRLWTADGGLGPNYPCFIWMKDKNSPGFVSGAAYQRIWESKRGIQHAESTWSPALNRNYIYIGADFRFAVTPRTYRTSKLIVELLYE